MSGPIGSSATLKLANNALAATLVAVLGEALALCASAGLARELVVEILSATASRVCDLKKTKIAQRDWSTDFALDLMLKDLNYTLETARNAKASLPLVATTQAVYDQARLASKGGQDFSVVTDMAT